MSTLPSHEAMPAPSAAWWQRRAGWLYDAIRAGSLPDVHEGVERRRHSLEAVLLGSIPLPDGQLVLADPYLMGDEPAPITRRLEPGEHRVHVVRATVGPDHRRNAAAMLSAHDARPVVGWDMALWPGQDLRTLGPEEYFGYGVDAGTGCFAGVPAARAAGRVLTADAGMLEDPVSASLFEEPGTEPGAAVVAAEPGAAPLAVFTSGWGDGRYPTWLGVDARGRVAVAVSDFLLTGDPFATDTSTQAAGPTSPRPWWRRWRRRP